MEGGGGWEERGYKKIYIYIYIFISVFCAGTNHGGGGGVVKGIFVLEFLPYSILKCIRGRINPDGYHQRSRKNTRKSTQLPIPPIMA